jgi:hypothetical protein
MMVRGSEPWVDNRHRHAQEAKMPLHFLSGIRIQHLALDLQLQAQLQSPILRYCPGRPSARFTTTTSTIYMYLRQRRRCNGGTFAPVLSGPTRRSSLQRRARQLGPRTGRFVHHSPPDKLAARALARTASGDIIMTSGVAPLWPARPVEIRDARVNN